MANIRVQKVSGESQLRQVHQIRREVFVDEQHCPPELEYANEEESVHFLATLNDVPCGAARWRRTANGFKLERFAVLKAYRGKGVGEALLSAVLADLPRDSETVYLNAQQTAIAFYERFYFVGVGDLFEEAGITHRKMVLPKLAFVTYDERPAISADDEVLADFFRKRFIPVLAVVWSDPGVDWSEFHLIVIRSTWDYYRRPEAFAEWLQRMGAERRPLMNPPAIVEWNKDKIYLKELAAKGIDIPHFHYCNRNGKYDLATLLNNMTNGRAVVKPSISAGSYNTFVVSKPVSADVADRFRGMLQNGAVVVQEFVEEITTHGELSLGFFDRTFSHAIRKVAVAGDFRVQPKFGGVPARVEVPQSLVAMCENLLAMIEGELLYARVDVVQRTDGAFTLMELELIEPVLFAEYDPGAAERFFNSAMRILRLLNP